MDIGLPQKGNSTFRNGEDIGIYLREHFPNIRILVSTSHSDNIRIINILNNLEPDVFLLKEDLNSGELNYTPLYQDESNEFNFKVQRSST